MAKRVGRKEDTIWNRIKDLLTIEEAFDALDQAGLNNAEVDKLAQDWRRANKIKKTHGII